MTEQHASGAVESDLGGAIEALKRNPRLAIGLGAATIVVLTLLAYLPAIRGEFIWDDDYYVTRNPLLKSLDGLQRIWFDIIPPGDYPLPQYYPLTHTTVWVEHKLWGLNPLGFHLTNVLLHVGNSLLIWLLLRKLDVPGAWLAAAIFAIHPINVESVAWIAERKNVLSGFFFFSSLYVYLRYAKVIAAPDHGDEYFSLPKEPERIWALAFALFFFALASKTVAATLPAVVLLLIWWKRGKTTRSDLMPLVPFFALSILAAILTGWMEVHRVGARGPDWDYSQSPIGEIAARCLIAGRALWFYVLKLVVPYPLIFNYPRWQINPLSPLQWMYPVAAVAVIVLLWLKRDRIGRGPLTASLYYAGTLFPALAFFNVFPMRFSFVADHFVYISSIGLIALMIALITRACALWLPREALSGALMAAAAVLAIFFLLTLAHADVFKSSRSLWEHTWKNNKASWFAANNYGVWIRDESREPDRLAKAEQWFNRVIELRPNHPEARFNLAVIAERRGDTDLAEKFYLEAIKLNPAYGAAHYQLGQLYFARGEQAKAIEQFERAIELDPRRADLARNALGYLLRQRGEFKEAIEQFQAALDTNPNFVAARNQLALALVEEDRIDEAIAEWTIALEQDPRNADVLNNLGQLMVKLERLPDAGHLFERAVVANPRSLVARTNFGTVAAMVGRLDVARRQFEAALEIDPNYQPARRKLADLESGKLWPASTQATTAPAAP